MKGLLSAPLSPRKSIEYLLLFLLLALVTSAAAYAGYWYGKREVRSVTLPKTSQEGSRQPPASRFPPAPPKLEEQSEDKTKGWLVFSSQAYPFTFKYPAEVKREEAVANNTKVIQLSLWGPTQKEGTELYDGLALSFSQPGWLGHQSLKSLAETYLERRDKDTSRVVSGVEKVRIGELEGYAYVLESLGTYRYILLESPYQPGLYIQIIELVSDPTGKGFQKTVDLIYSTFRFLDQKSADETAGWKTYTSERYKYSIKYPPSWSYEITNFTGYEHTITFRESGGVDVTFYINKGRQISGVSKANCSDWLNSYKTEGYTTDSITVDGITALRVFLKKEGPAHNPPMGLICFEKGGVTYEFQCVDGPEGFSDRTNLMLATFKFLD